MYSRHTALRAYDATPSNRYFNTLYPNHLIIYSYYYSYRSSDKSEADMHKRYINIMALSILLIAISTSTQARSQALIPDHCFVKGEVDCERQGCKQFCTIQLPDITNTRSADASPSASQVNTSTSNQSNPNPSLKDSNAPKLNVETTPQPKAVIPPFDYIDCIPIKDNPELAEDYKHLNSYRRWIAVEQDRIEHNIFDKRGNYESKMHNEDMADLYELNVAKHACYKVGNRCIQNGDKTIQAKINEFSDTLIKLKLTRHDVYDYILNCTDLKLDCTRHEYSWRPECTSYRSCFSSRYNEERLEELQLKKSAQYQELSDMQCTHPDD